MTSRRGRGPAVTLCSPGTLPGTARRSSTASARWAQATRSGSWTTGGAQVVYQVVMNESMDPNDPATLQMMYPADHDMLTIVTCGGSFYRTGDPVFGGEYTSRTVIRAALVSITRV